MAELNRKLDAVSEYLVLPKIFIKSEKTAFSLTYSHGKFVFIAEPKTPITESMH